MENENSRQAARRGRCRLEARGRNREAALLVNLLDRFKRADAFGEAGLRCAVLANVADELVRLGRPRVVAARVFPDRRLRRTHFGEHLVERETFETVAAAQAVDRNLRVPTVDFEGEEVFPLGAADVEPRGLAAGGA